MTDPIHIIGLKAEHVKRLAAVDLTFDDAGGLIEVTGANGAGKSSLLDLALWAFGGKGAQDAVPVTLGEDRGELEVRTSNGLTIKWAFTEGGKHRYLTVTNQDGFQATKQQGLLTRLLGPGGSLDPHEFMRLAPTAQAERLRALTGLDTRDLDADIGRLFDERRDLNAGLRREQVLLGEQEAPPENWAALYGPALHDIDTAEMLDEMQRSLAQNSALESERGQVARARADVEREGREVAALDEQMVELQDRLAAKVEERDSRSRALRAAQEDVAAAEDKLARSQPIDVAVLREMIDAAKVDNAQRAEWRQYLEQATRMKSAAADAEAKTGELEAARAAKREAIGSASMPVDGLAFDEANGEVVYGGLPFAQASHSEQLRVSLAIAMALQPELRVICFSDASLLDEDSLAVVRELAVEEGYQIFAEIVGGPREDSIHIVDGRVVQPRVRGPSVEAEASLAAAAAKLDACTHEISGVDDAGRNVCVDCGLILDDLGADDA